VRARKWKRRALADSASSPGRDAGNGPLPRYGHGSTVVTVTKSADDRGLKADTDLLKGEGPYQAHDDGQERPMSDSPTAGAVTVTTEGYARCTCGAWMLAATDGNWAIFPHCTNCHAVQDGYDPEEPRHVEAAPAWRDFPAREAYDTPTLGISGHLACTVCGKCGPAQQPGAYWGEPKPAAIYCSGKCRQKAYRARRKNEPERYSHESVPVTVTPWPAMDCASCKGAILSEVWFDTWGAYCSRECRTASPGYVHVGETGTCQQCGRVMHGVNSGRKFCTPLCRKRASRKNGTTAQRKKWREGQSERDAKINARLAELDALQATDIRAAERVAARRAAQRDIEQVNTPPWAGNSALES
jgi:hypothetical protein